MSPTETKDHKQRLLSLIGKGEAFRDEGSQPIRVETTTTRKAKARDVISESRSLDVNEEPPPERPEILESYTPVGGMQLRERRRGMRSDPA